MDYCLLLRLSHITRLILLGGGLLAVFVSELRAHTTGDVQVFAEAAWMRAEGPPEATRCASQRDRRWSTQVDSRRATLRA
jgi:hypothetical protein